MSKSETTENLHTYLNDHLAGAFSALTLLDDLIENHQQDRFAQFFSDLRNDIQADEESLRDLMHKTGGQDSSVRKAGAWILEKFGQAKMRAGEDEYGLLQAVEALVLGISGKKLLWHSLEAIAPTQTALQGIDFERLKARAQEQIERAERERILIARNALSDREQT